ncbi:MAG: ribonuclease P protein component 1 [Candidatus Methanoperedens sp.]|nr:ribonuclease P protein component 1 [Candidatus Methanoperedens sp.]
MKLTPQNIMHHELIGLDTEIVDSTNSSLIGIEGRIVDETKNLMIVESDDKERNIPKSCSSFIFTIPSFNGKRYLPLKIKVDGKLLLSQPENRIQTKFKKKFRK